MSASNSLMIYRMSIDQKKWVLVYHNFWGVVSLATSVNTSHPECTMWDFSHNRWQEVCSLLLEDATAFNAIYSKPCALPSSLNIFSVIDKIMVWYCAAVRKHHPSLVLASAVISRGLCRFLSGRCWKQALRGPWLNLSVLLIDWAINIAGTLWLQGLGVSYLGLGWVQIGREVPACCERILSWKAGINIAKCGGRGATW